MRLSFSVSLLVAAALAVLSSTEALGQKSEEMHARDAVDRFMNALKAEDLDGVLKSVSFPFYFDRRQILEKDAELRSLLKEQVDRSDYSDLAWKIKMVHRLEDVVAKASAEEKLLLDKVTRAGDLVIEIAVTHNGREDGAALFVRVADGKGSILGLSD
jgi:hypothetical protein